MHHQTLHLLPTPQNKWSCCVGWLSHEKHGVFVDMFKGLSQAASVLQQTECKQEMMSTLTRTKLWEAYSNKTYQKIIPEQVWKLRHTQTKFYQPSALRPLGTFELHTWQHQKLSVENRTKQSGARASWHLHVEGGSPAWKQASSQDTRKH